MKARATLSIRNKKADKMYRWDVFISHASEDKESFVCPLVNALEKKGLRVWYDDFTLDPGDPLRKSIDEGISLSRFGIVVLSKAYFSKKWPQAELEGLLARSDYRNKILIPILHNINLDELLKYSPTLSGHIGIMADKGLDHVVNQILKVTNEPTAELTPAGRLVGNILPGLELYEWTPKAVHLGLASELLCERSGNIEFSEKYVKSLCIESKKTAENVKSFFDEDWPQFILSSASMIWEPEAITSEDDLYYLISHLSQSLMSYLYPIAYSAKLISPHEGEGFTLGDGIWDMFHHALGIRVKESLALKSKNIQSAIMGACIDVVKSHLLLYRKDALHHLYLLAFYLFILLSASGQIQKIERTFPMILTAIDKEYADEKAVLKEIDRIERALETLNKSFVK